MLNACLIHCYVNVDMPSDLLELFIALDYDECEGEFYEEVEPTAKPKASCKLIML